MGGCHQAHPLKASLPATPPRHRGPPRRQPNLVRALQGEQLDPAPHTRWPDSSESAPGITHHRATSHPAWRVYRVSSYRHRARPSYSLTSATGLYKSQSVPETPPHRRALPSFTVRAPPGSAQPAPGPIIPGDPATGSIPWIATLTGHCSPAQRASPGSCNVPQEPAPGGPTLSRPGNRHTPGHPLPARCALRLGQATDCQWP